MRFERLFTDLEAQIDAADVAELEAEVADRTRGEQARVSLADRLRATVGGSIRVRVLGAGSIGGVIRSVGPDWVLVREVSGADAVIATAAIVEVTGLARVGRDEQGSVARRLDLRYVLRGLVRDRTTVAVAIVDGAVLVGTVVAVGADSVDVVETRLDEPFEWSASPGSAGARAGAPQARVLPLRGIALVRER